MSNLKKQHLKTPYKESTKRQKGRQTHIVDRIKRKDFKTDDSS